MISKSALPAVMVCLPARMACLLAVVVCVTLAACGVEDPGGPAPRLARLDDVLVTVGEPVSILVTASDPGEGPLTFGILGRPPQALFLAQEDGYSARFTWTPGPLDAGAEGREHLVEFLVENQSGRMDSAIVSIFVVPATTPEFLGPPGVIWSSSRQNHVEFLVEVKDDGVARVQWSLEEAPEGAWLEQVDRKVAHFFWAPSPGQAEERVLWAVRFRAVGVLQEEEVYETYYLVVIAKVD